MKRNSKKIKPWEGIGFTVGMFGTIIMCCEAESFGAQFICAFIGFTVLALGVVIYNLPKVINYLTKKEKAPSDKKPKQRVNKNNIIITEGEENVNGNTLEKVI